MLKAEVEEKYGKNPNAGIIKRQASSLARRESKLKMTRNQFQEMGSNSRPNSGSIPRPNSALDLEATPDLPQKGQMTLPRIKKPKQFEKIVNRNSDDNTGSKNGTLKRERSKRLSGWYIDRPVNDINVCLVNMDNIKGSVKETLTKAAAKITKQMSTDDTRDSLAKKSQSQIELRENVRTLNIVILHQSKI